MKSEDWKIVLIFAAALLAVAAAIVISQHAVQRWIESDHMESDAREIVQRIKQLETHIALAESEQRDFILSALNKDLRALRQLAADDAKQRTRWEMLEKLLSQRLAELQSRAAANKETSDKLRALLRNISHEQSLSLHERIEHKQAQMFSTVKQITLILLGGTVLFLCVFWLLRREIRARRAAEAKLREQHDALEKALRDLQQSHWHLDKVAEFLPICMECGKVKTAETQWESIIDYFRKNELLFSHGLCPECGAKVRKDFAEKRNGTSRPTPA